MKSVSLTRRILIGILAVAVAGWVVDTLRSRTPQAAQAASATTEAAPAEAANGEDLAALVQRLVSDHYAPVSAELERLERDLFVPTPLMQAETAPASEPGELSEALDESPPGLEFSNKHLLTGVIIGHLPLAQVDGRLLPLGAVLEGHTLIAIERDFVVFENATDSERITLELKPRSTGAGESR